MRLLLIRHGSTDANERGLLTGRSEIPLNARGESEASAIARVLSTVPLTAILASPLARARRTAEIVGLPHRLAPEFDDRLIETDIGAWRDKTRDELRDDPDFIRYQADVTHRCAAIEPAEDVHDRVLSFLDGQMAHWSDVDDATVALVSHADPLRLLIAHLLGLELRHFKRLHVDTASLSSIRIDGDRISVSLINWRPAADGLVGSRIWKP